MFDEVGWPAMGDVEAIRFQRCCDLYGRPVEVDLIVRGGRISIQFPSSVLNPCRGSEGDNPAYIARLNKILQPLTPAERRTFVLIHVLRRSIAETSQIEKCSRQAIYSRIKSMIRKSLYCRASADAGCLAHKVNQYR
jgi:hypothetical protein